MRNAKGLRLAAALALALATATAAPGATNVFSDLDLGPAGALVGDGNDLWQIGGRFDNASTNPAYNVLASTFEFTGTAGHDLEQAGRDRGPRWSALTNNWGFGTLRIPTGTVTVVDNRANSAGPDAVYAAALSGGGTLVVGAGMVFYFGSTSAWSGVVLTSGGGVFRPLLADLGDADGDGVNNGNEIDCGTDPTNALSYLHISAFAQSVTNVNVTWTTVGGKGYIVQAAPLLTGDPAVNFTNVTGTVTASGTGESVTNAWISGTPTNVSPRFFRIQLAPAP